MMSERPKSMMVTYVVAAVVSVLLSSGCLAQSTQIYGYQATGGYDPSGNVLSSTDLINGAWSMGYDSLNRLTSATATSGPSSGAGLGWQYDSFGNRSAQTDTSGNYTSWAQLTPSGGTDPGTNRIVASSAAVSGVAYDGAGNVTDYGANSYVYDGEGRVCAVQSPVGITQYVYDAEGNRVAKISASSFACYTGSASPNVMTSYIVDSGQQVTELNQAGQWMRSKVYAGGALLANYDTNGLHYPLADPLGTVRVWANAAGAVEATCSSLPFGDNQVCSGNTPSNNHFTGKERDAESGLDYFGARYYGSNMGRFTSPDDGSDQNQSDPQSFNLYSYGRNNPITNTDPTGNDCVTQTRTSDTTESVSVNSGNCSGNVGDGQTQTYVNGTVTGISVNGGNSLDIGYNSYDGQSSGVTNASSAPTPDRPGLAYGYGNNAQGYRMLGAASRAANTGTAIYAGIFAAGACAVYCPAAAATAAFNAKNLYYTATGLLPVAYTAVQKLANLNISVSQANEIIESPTTQRLVDNANGGNVNYVAEIAGKLVRITTDPAGQRIISAGTMRANQIANGLKSGRFN